MLTLARQANIFHLPESIAETARNRLTRMTENSPGLDARVANMVSTTVCLATLDNRPIFTAALLGQKDTFTAHCLAAIPATINTSATDR